MLGIGQSVLGQALPARRVLLARFGPVRAFCEQDLRSVSIPETQRPRFRGLSEWAVLGSNQ
jgi:hypothetical protein